LLDIGAKIARHLKKSMFSLMFFKKIPFEFNFYVINICNMFIQLFRLNGFGVKKMVNLSI